MLITKPAEERIKRQINNKLNINDFNFAPKKESEYYARNNYKEKTIKKENNKKQFLIKNNMAELQYLLNEPENSYIYQGPQNVMTNILNFNKKKFNYKNSKSNYIPLKQLEEDQKIINDRKAKIKFDYEVSNKLMDDARDKREAFEEMVKKNNKLYMDDLALGAKKTKFKKGLLDFFASITPIESEEEEKKIDPDFKIKKFGAGGISSVLEAALIKKEGDTLPPTIDTIGEFEELKTDETGEGPLIEVEPIKTEEDPITGVEIPIAEPIKPKKIIEELTYENINKSTLAMLDKYAFSKWAEYSKFSGLSKKLYKSMKRDDKRESLKDFMEFMG